LTAAAALLRSSSSMLLGVRLYDSRVVAPPLLCSGQQGSPVLRLQVVCPRRCCRRPMVELDLEVEDGGLDRVPVFLQGPLCIF
jgi:hypothetical protein